MTAEQYCIPMKAVACDCSSQFNLLHTPQPQPKSGLFSATQTEAVQALARAGLRNAVRVNVAVSRAAAAPRPDVEGVAEAAGWEAELQRDELEQRTPGTLSICYHIVEAVDKLAVLAHFLQVRVLMRGGGLAGRVRLSWVACS